MKVTRIEKEHVGMEVTAIGDRNEFFVITAIGEKNFLVLDKDRFEVMLPRNGDYRFREPKEEKREILVCNCGCHKIMGDKPVEKELKPSERINQMIGKTSFDAEWETKAIEKTIEYLDELREAGKL